MSQQALLSIVAWAFILMVPINGYIVWHGWTLNRSVTPRSSVLRALLWTKFSIWLLNLYLAVIGHRYLNHIEPVMPFGGVGLSAVFLFLLTAPIVIHYQMRRFLETELERTEIRNAACDEGRDEIRDEARDAARDAELDNGS